MSKVVLLLIILVSLNLSAESLSESLTTAIAGLKTVSSSMRQSLETLQQSGESLAANLIALTNGLSTLETSFQNYKTSNDLLIKAQQKRITTLIVGIVIAGAISVAAIILNIFT